MLSPETIHTYVDILREELVPATGCTEPIAIAYAAALLRQTLGAAPERVLAEVSGNIIKNVKSVIVPNTGGLKGIQAAVAAGVVAGRADQILQVISDVPEDKLGDIARYANKVLVMAERKLAMYDTVERVFDRASELLELGLSVPQVTKIFLKLREMGIDLPTDVYTIPYAVKTILEAKARRDAGENLTLPRRTVGENKKGGEA